jgi:hypothetical protein
MLHAPEAIRVRHDECDPVSERDSFSDLLSVANTTMRSEMQSSNDEQNDMN